MPRKYHQDKTGQLKKVCALYQRGNRQKYNQILVEGPQAVRELLLWHRSSLRDVYATESALCRHTDIAALLDEIDSYLHILPEKLFTQLFSDAQGIIAVCTPPAAPELKDLFSNSSLLLYAWQAVNPGNLGTIIRSADAAGADGVLVGTDSVDLGNPKLIRSSVGSIFHLPLYANATLSAVVALAREATMQIFLADGGGENLLSELSEETLRMPTLWIVGNEAHGASSELKQVADKTISVPMWGKVESLNLAVAASLCLYTSSLAQRS